jgi:hypothetical protein
MSEHLVSVVGALVNSDEQEDAQRAAVVQQAMENVEEGGGFSSICSTRQICQNLFKCPQTRRTLSSGLVKVHASSILDLSLQYNITSEQTSS